MSTQTSLVLYRMGKATSPTRPNRSTILRTLLQRGPTPRLNVTIILVLQKKGAPTLVLPIGHTSLDIARHHDPPKNKQ